MVGGFRRICCRGTGSDFGVQGSGFRFWGVGCGVQGVGFGQLLHRNVKRFRGGLVVKAHRLLYHSTLGLRETKKRRRFGDRAPVVMSSSPGSELRVWDFAVHIR